MTPGPSPHPDGSCRFVVWAPEFETVSVHLIAPGDRVVRLEPRDRGYHVAEIADTGPGALYKIRLGDQPERPDPASRFQPDGLHGPSQVVDPAFDWTDSGWRGIRLDKYVFYEMHVGTFTPEGTFEAAIPHLDGLRDLGVTAVEIMPVAQFPGDRNWGYDGAAPYAVQNSYGGPAGLKRLVDACHRRGLAVVLDVVYNHLGPEGNYVWGAAPYFTDRYRTPWGAAINFDGAWSDEVRNYFVQNALLWVREYHVDALRLDAVHAIVDPSARPFLQDLAEEVHAAGEELGRSVHLFPESDRNDPHLIWSPERGGWGLDAVWNDDVHHVLHVLLTGERSGYYQDFGRVEELARAWTEGFVYSGQVSRFRNRRHGAPARVESGAPFVVCVQNHDQIGNRMRGDRFTSLLSYEKLKLAAGALILSPHLPLLFMGEEYGETAPFPYFVSHSDPGLIEAVRKGRREEFTQFKWKGEPPDPQSETTFRSAKLDRGLLRKPENAALWEVYKTLLSLRRDRPALANLRFKDVHAGVDEGQKIAVMLRAGEGEKVAVVYNFSDTVAVANLPGPGSWTKLFDSADPRWRGPGTSAPDQAKAGKISLPASSFVVYSA